ncbi:MAG: hypothetical protein HYV97_08010 [Bdellovibrio sp.]|nr:hypothetical protein [Bdellovibrio sp.]
MEKIYKPVGARGPFAQKLGRFCTTRDRPKQGDLDQTRPYKRRSGSGFCRGITGFGSGTVKGSHALIQFETAAGETFCLNEGLIKHRPTYFKGPCAK